MRNLRSLAGAATIATLVLAGAAGAAGDEQPETTSKTAAAAKPLTRATFVAQVSSLCRSASNQLDRLGTADTLEEITAQLKAIGPIADRLADQIAALGPPAAGVDTSVLLSSLRTMARSAREMSTALANPDEVQQVVQGEPAYARLALAELAAMADADVNGWTDCADREAPATATSSPAGSAAGAGPAGAGAGDTHATADDTDGTADTSFETAANVRRAEVAVRSAFTAEKVHYTDNASYTDDPAALRAIEPALRYARGVVKGSSPAEVVYVAVAKGTGRQVLCLSTRTPAGTRVMLKDDSTSGTTYALGAVPSVCDGKPLPLESW